ncbi:glutamate carboxypeptidase protein [Atractiella rhizophila]|nr:glutamate carboxypeptidase protein [Atractiella rhizophila]
MASQETLSKFFAHVDSLSPAFIDRLSKAVSIPSVSGEPVRRKFCFEMADWLEGELKAVGVSTEKRDLGKHVMDGKELDLPPIVLGKIGEDKNKKTILLYGHYDVQPAEKSDGWTYEPFVLTHEKSTDRLFGRGSTDDKGPVLGWINVLQAHKELGIDLPVNLRFCFEGMEENGSEGLDALVREEAGKYFKDVDAVCISDNYWLGTETPCLTYGLRGIAYYKATISGPGADLHSGVFGGTVHEPMTDLFHLFSKLVSPQGKILVPGLNELVDPLTEEERKRYEKIDFSVSNFATASVGASTTLSEDKITTLMGRMRYPSLSLHGIEGAFYGAGSKTVIPATVHGKFSIRLVPSLTVANVTPLVEKYIKDEFTKLNSKNKLSFELSHGGESWITDPNHYSFVAASKATKTVYGKEPDFTREGGSIPIVLSFEQALKKSVLLLPMGRGDDGAHSTNEKLDLSNYIQGTKLLGAYLHEVGAAQA